jgi:AraC family transcriptional regulator of adaptative response / DNA-3-methyladenine glycosylase II
MSWAAMLRFLAARAVPGVESVADGCYARTADIRGCKGWLRVETVDGLPRLQVALSTTLVPVLATVLARVKHLFDLDSRPDLIDAHLERDSRIAPMVRQCPGLRVPGAFSGFELALRAIVGQQISVSAATTLSGRLAATFGKPIETPHAGLSRLSPAADTLAHAGRAALMAVGLTSARADCIQRLACAVAEKRLHLDWAADPEPTLRQLLALPGIGPWTAEYISMRALRWPDAFPVSDLGLRKALGVGSARQVQNASAAWRPWRACAVMHLWNSLAGGQERAAKERYERALKGEQG